GPPLLTADARERRRGLARGPLRPPLRPSPVGARGTRKRSRGRLPTGSRVDVAELGNTSWVRAGSGRGPTGHSQASCEVSNVTSPCGQLSVLCSRSYSFLQWEQFSISPTEHMSRVSPLNTSKRSVRLLGRGSHLGVLAVLVSVL